MNKIVITTVSVIALAAATLAYAGGACCGVRKQAAADSKAGARQACDGFLAKLNLSEEQKTKVAALRAECDKSGCSETSRAKFMAGLKDILTPEQLAQCQAACDKASAGCAAAKTAAKAD